jgi:hypothetical protein
MYGFKKCIEETGRMNWIKRFFACVPSVLDYHIRKRDFWLHRSYDGLSKRILKIDGHAPIAILMPAAFLLFLIYGPTLGWRGGGALLLLLISWTCLYMGAKLLREKYLLRIQLGIFIGVALAVWFLAGPDTHEFDKEMYRNFFIPALLPYVIVPLVLAKVLSKKLFLKFSNTETFRSLLPHVKLLPKPPEAPKFSYWFIFHSLIHAPLRYPLYLLFFPALGTLFIPYNFHVNWWAGGLILITWLLLSFFSLHDRFNYFLPILRRTFFTGGTLFVSLVIIVLGAGRLFGISYIQTVVESSNWKILIRYIFAFYIFFWVVEYWLNRLLLERILQLLKKPNDPPGKVNYDIDPQDPISSKTIVEPSGRKIQVHAGTRIMAIGRIRKGKPGSGHEIFQSYEKRELFERILEQATLNEYLKKDITKEERALPAEISRRIRSYFSTVNIYLIVVTICIGLFLHYGFQQPQAEVTLSEASPTVDLPGLIWQDPANDRVILLAASGGGTRAALYTQSVLRGLHTLGALEDLVLASGVSGGAAALAYFAAHKKELIEGNDDLWNQYACDMTYPFIWDVLEGAAEWRITSKTRLGKLLSESFERVFHSQKNGHTNPSGAGNPATINNTLGKVDGLGLILNTALAGHLDSEACPQAENIAEASVRCRDLTDNSLSGGRLIFTNLKDVNIFETRGTNQGLPYITVQDYQVSLSVAAALSANFPPVFPNAAVDIDKTDRYWVTDGGAMDNRGLISLLLALEGALERLPAESESLPDILIIMAEASAGSTQYQQDRGIGTRFGASEKIANKLIYLLRESVTATYNAKGGKLEFFDLTMPEFLRIDGGLGTHWMLPRTIKMKAPRTDSTTSPYHLEIDAVAARQLVNDLHQSTDSVHISQCYHEPRPDPKGRDELPKIREWIKANKHQGEWAKIKRVLE